MVTLPESLICIGASEMTLKKFVEKLRSMLKNPNALLLDNGVIYFYTNEQQFIALDTKEAKAVTGRR